MRIFEGISSTSSICNNLFFVFPFNFLLGLVKTVFFNIVTWHGQWKITYCKRKVTRNSIIIILICSVSKATKILPYSGQMEGRDLLVSHIVQLNQKKIFTSRKFLFG